MRTIAFDTADQDLDEQPARRRRPSRGVQRRDAIRAGLGLRRHRTDVRSRWAV